MKIIVSASRRSDLVTCYPEKLVEEVSKIGLENIHTLVIWTKNPANMLDNHSLLELLGKLDQVYLNLTVTGLGGTFLEPKVPTPEEIFQRMPDVIKLIGSPQRISLRYDPLIEVADFQENRFTNITPDIFIPILKQTARLGIPIIRTSYATPYWKVLSRFKRLGLTFVEHPLEEITGFIQGIMMEEAGKLGVEVRTCVVPHLTDSGGCIDGKLLRELHPYKERCSIAVDRSQRECCHCTKSQDIGNWDSCANGCLYCYGNPKIYTV
ncbi:MAG: DUF1848 family protein [Candidatus Schekmanbacteria bacterium]|nr:DUF1848 family protein [Candidatus Schekmanbacteria bacterium]